MIKLNENTKAVNQRTWRRRISNQLAGFAAIMLFASTQVGAPESTLNMNSAKSQIASQSVLNEISTPQLELTASLDQAGGESSRKNTTSKKKKAFNLNLFRFRH